MYGYIYKTTNLVNNIIYVGQHKADKFMGRRYLGSGKEIKAAIKEFGRSNFTCELLDTALTISELNEKEAFWISKLDATNPEIGYNKDPGGHLVDIKNHLLILDNGYIQVAEKDVEKYIVSGWTEIFQNRQIQQEYDEQFIKKVNKTAVSNLTNEEKIALRKKREHEHYLANKEKYIERAKKWRANNLDKVKKWQIENKDRLNAKDRAIYNSDTTVRQKRLDSCRRYREAHREEILEKQRKHRQLKK